MGGLFDTFQRHSDVLTNFPVKLTLFRPYWPGGGIPRGPGYQGGPAGQDRPGPEGGYPGARPAAGSPELLMTTHSRPSGPSGARSAVMRTSPRARGRWVGITLPYPPSYTRPVHRPSHAHDPHRTTRRVRVHLGHAHMTVLAYL